MSRDWIALYLEEDIGSGDVTSEAVFGPAQSGRAKVVARERAFVAGTLHAKEVFLRLGATAHVVAEDGQWVERGAVILDVHGPVRAILSAERLALNILARMSGIASRTRELMEELGKACSASAVAGTRKTTPGFRLFEKEAIRIAGGDPHRMGLFDEAMVKDNHAAACGSVAEAVRRVRKAQPNLVITAEVESLEDALAAAGSGADWLLIDNQAPKTGESWAKTVWDRFPHVKVEASGGITPETLTQYGWADRVSLGALTQKTANRDFALDWDA